MKTLAYWLLVAVAFISLAACGGGGATGSSTTVTGTVYAAPVSGASVAAYDSIGSLLAGPVTTAPDGSFSLAVPDASLALGVHLESTGGTFTDEATNLLTSAGTLGVHIPAGPLTNTSVNIDPSSTVISLLVKDHGMTLYEATAVYNSAFGYAPDITVTPDNTPPSGADTSAAMSALRAMTFSQLTKDLGLASGKQFDLLAALADDLADGSMDGLNTGSTVIINGASALPLDILNKYEKSFAASIANTSYNLTELTAGQIGNMPFSKVALTSSYKVVYVPGMMAPIAGKSMFQIHVFSLVDNSPVTGQTLMLMPLMHMSTMNHSAPVDAVTEDGSNPGTYKCTAYYLMASGLNMGYWEMKVKIGSGMSAETATFYPQVGMGMGTTTQRATLKGQTDFVNSMTNEKRTYYLFNDGGTTAATFKLFLAAKESMMSFPAVYNGVSLTNTTAAWTAAPVNVFVSTDASSWVQATHTGSGHWSVAGLTGLTSGAQGTIYVKLDVNGEQKSTDGNTVSGANGYASFNVTPQ